MGRTVFLLTVVIALLPGAVSRADPATPLPPVVSPTPVPAPAGRDTARAAFRSGLEQMWAGHWAAALAALEASYGAMPTQLALIDAAICLERLGRDEDAVVRLRQLQERFGRAMSAERRAQVERSLARLTGTNPRVAVSATVEGAIIRIDGQDVGRAPMLEPIALPAGPHVIEARHPGRVTVVRQIVLLPTDRREISLDLGPVASR